MRKLNLLFVLILCSLFAGKALAQSDAIISKIVKNGNRMELTVVSSKPFRIGGNTHILYIAGKEFSLNKQNNVEGKGYITFYIPVEDYNKLNDGDFAWMSYGNKFTTAPDSKADPAVFLKGIANTWVLGTLKK